MAEPQPEIPQPVVAGRGRGRFAAAWRGPEANRPADLPPKIPQHHIGHPVVEDMPTGPAKHDRGSVFGPAWARRTMESTAPANRAVVAGRGRHRIRPAWRAEEERLAMPPKSPTHPVVEVEPIVEDVPQNLSPPPAQQHSERASSPAALSSPPRLSSSDESPRQENTPDASPVLPLSPPPRTHRPDHDSDLVRWCKDRRHVMHRLPQVGDNEIEFAVPWRDINCLRVGDKETSAPLTIGPYKSCLTVKRNYDIEVIAMCRYYCQEDQPRTLNFTLVAVNDAGRCYSIIKRSKFILQRGRDGEKKFDYVDFSFKKHELRHGGFRNEADKIVFRLQLFQ